MGSKNCERWAACLAAPNNQEDYFYGVRVGQLARYSQMLLRPLGIPPMLALAFSTRSLSQDPAPLYFVQTLGSQDECLVFS